ncbi:MAG: molybdopterin-guanine dinucleotide biosynthesis protein B [Betaproteobacteria bacterium RIFCSPLOWO2_12_FULL_64_23]|nr:MAG: molybdopterin-guanine dinucleotide biosynthesis protein B [Betaproteobacteria bacterium RIFCSPLOWO2_12_FULL_64_23]
MKIFGFAGWSGSGKTTLIEQVIPRFVRTGLKVSLIKHAHHRFDVDQPGKDSFRHRTAGCSEVLVTSGERWVLMHEMRGAPEATLEQQIARMSPCDLLLIEGYKRYPLPKLEIYREANGKPLLHPEDEHIVALATDTPVPCRLPQFGLEDYDAITAFVVDTLELKR